MFEDLSKKQKEILDFIKKEQSLRGYPPSVREICAAVSLKSTSTVHGHLERLEKKGYIRRDPTKPRAIEILYRGDEYTDEVSLGKETVSIPVVGKITAGMPILAQENIEDSFPVPAEFAPRGTSYMLKVKGDSMINAGIHDGDYIMVVQQNTASDGEIVVALIGEEVTLKRFFKEKDCIRLQPENENMEPIYAKEVSVMGKVVGLFRTSIN